MKEVTYSGWTPGVPALGERDHITAFVQGTDGLTWGRTGVGQLVLVPETFLRVQGQWDPGDGVGNS